MAELLSDRLKLPALSKDRVKELLFDHVGFQSREGKVDLGVASTEILYYAADQLMRAGQPFILENNFEYASEHGFRSLLNKYPYAVLTVTLTGDYRVIYRRFLERENSPFRHRGHVVNDCYPESKDPGLAKPPSISYSYEDFVRSIQRRGFDAFSVGGRQMKVDTTDFSKVDMEALFSSIAAWREEVLQAE